MYFLIFGPVKQLPLEQERDAVAGCATVCVQYGYANCTVWRWTTTDKNTQLKNKNLKKIIREIA
jgi:hypothetical protein